MSRQLTLVGNYVNFGSCGAGTLAVLGSPLADLALALKAKLA